MTPQNENARRCERRALPYNLQASQKLSPDSDTLKSALSDPEKVLGLLGLLDGAKRQAHGFMVCCPWHAERTPSCSVKLASDGTIAAHCSVEQPEQPKHPSGVRERNLDGAGVQC